MIKTEKKKTGLSQFGKTAGTIIKGNNLTKEDLVTRPR